MGQSGEPKMNESRLSCGRAPDFDIDRKNGAQAELWVLDICETMAAGKGEIEVKAPKPFLRRGSPYIEYCCKHIDGKWHPSGIATSKAKVWAITFGSLPGMLVIETEWLRRAARLAYEKRQLLEETDGANPTKGVFVTFKDLWDTKDHNP
jgi:hypothetical protein